MKYTNQACLAFTGHRPESLPFGNDETDPRCLRLLEMLYAEIISKAEQGYTTFYSGAARGSDIFFAEQVIRVKQSVYPHIRLICAVPHEGQANRWSEDWRERNFSMLEQADGTVVISTKYTRDCFYQRNRFMVDHASALLAVYNNAGRGGTAYTIQYAYQRNIEIVKIDPITLAREVLPSRHKIVPTSI